ncbi:hypothetical protein F5888DRAFT_1620043, partial [Russula emetica]
FDVPDANLIIRSSDLVNFRVHKPVLAMASPFFKDLLSHPQPSDSEFVDGLPEIQLSEDSELLNCLISILYPVRTVKPKSYEKVFDLLAACQKYDMVSLLSRSRNDLKLQLYTHPLDIHSRIREEYVKALQTHLDCKFCVAVHAKKGFAYCAELEKKSYITRDHETMSTVPTGEASTTDEPLENLLFDYPGADIVLRSQDSHHFRVPKIYIINSSPVLGELIQRALDSPRTVAKAEVSLPVVQLPECSEILRCLLTFIFPLIPLVPSTPEEIMNLLSVAQEYKMGTVLIHIRGSIARENLLPTRLEPALHIYTLAQKYGLRPEALQAARAISNYSVSIDDFDDKLDIMPGASLYELWKYYEKVRAILASDLTEFRISDAHGNMATLRCDEYSSSDIPNWVDQYIESVGEAPNLFNLVEFYAALALHIEAPYGNPAGFCECGGIAREDCQTIREFWEALASVVHGSFEKASVFDVLSC